MKLKMNFLVISAMCAAVFCSDAFAADPGASHAFDIKAILLGSITLTKIQDLSFPQQSVGTAETSYIVKPKDATSAAFSATGTSNAIATLTFGAAAVDLACNLGTGTCTPGTNTIIVNAFTCDITNCSYQFDSTGRINSMSFGATENVAANSKSGTYTGSQTITLTYQ